MHEAFLVSPVQIKRQGISAYLPKFVLKRGERWKERKKTRVQGSESLRRDSETEDQEREPELEKGMKKRGKETLELL